MTCFSIGNFRSTEATPVLIFLSSGGVFTHEHKLQNETYHPIRRNHRNKFTNNSTKNNKIAEKIVKDLPLHGAAWLE